MFWELQSRASCACHTWGARWELIKSCCFTQQQVLEGKSSPGQGGGSGPWSQGKAGAGSEASEVCLQCGSQQPCSQKSSASRCFVWIRQVRRRGRGLRRPRCSDKLCWVPPPQTRWGQGETAHKQTDVKKHQPLMASQDRLENQQGILLLPRAHPQSGQQGERGDPPPCPLK